MYNGQAWWDRAGKRSNTWLATKYYTFNGQRIAMRDETGLTYLHADQLGSTALTTNGSGATLDDQGYNAYGKDRRGSELRTAQRFTGQPGDATGLLYYGARYYDPQLGQFISPDTLVPDATNLFDYNRYMYARGNPMKYNDPTGHDPCDNGNKKCDPLWLEYTRGELGCASGPCGITFEQFLAAKQQYLAYKQTPENYDADIQIINGDSQGNFTDAQGRQSNAQLYAEYFGHSNTGVDIKQLAGTETMLASITMLSGSAKDSLPAITFNSRQLQAKFKHAGDFGITGSWNQSNALQYRQAIEAHIADPNTVAIPGTYRTTNSVTHYYNSSTQLDVMVDLNGDYVSGWRLGGAQENNLLNNGNVR